MKEKEQANQQVVGLVAERLTRRERKKEREKGKLRAKGMKHNVVTGHGRLQYPLKLKTEDHGRPMVMIGTGVEAPGLGAVKVGKTDRGPKGPP